MKSTVLRRLSALLLIKWLCPRGWNLTVPTTSFRNWRWKAQSFTLSVLNANIEEFFNRFFYFFHLLFFFLLMLLSSPSHIILARWRSSILGPLQGQAVGPTERRIRPSQTPAVYAGQYKKIRTTLSRAGFEHVNQRLCPLQITKSLGSVSQRR